MNYFLNNIKYWVFKLWIIEIDYDSSRQVSFDSYDFFILA